MIVVVILGVVIAIVAILFAFQNATVVTISLGTLTLQQSLAIVLLITLGIGIIISLLLSLPTIIKRGWINSRQKKKIGELQGEIHSLQQQLKSQDRYSQTLQHNQQELYQIFDLADRVTGLLTQESTITVASYLLQQLKTRLNNPGYSSLTAFIIAVEPVKDNLDISPQEWENSITRAIAKRISAITDVNSYLGVTQRKRFVCLTLGIVGEQAQDYSDRIVEQFKDRPLQKADGTTLNLKAAVGGAIVDPADTIDSRNLLKAAESNLERAREQKRSHIVITEIVGDRNEIANDSSPTDLG